MNRHLVVFARAPRLGAQKQRLARDIGRMGALKFYWQNTERLLRDVCADCRWTTWVSVTPDGETHHPLFRLPGARITPQGRGDLGQRMARPFHTLPPGPVVLIGSDIPELGRDQVADAFKALGSHHAVFGPATDGGYWLVGLKRLRSAPPGLFAGARWSTEHALADSIATLPRGSRVAQLPALSDVDTGRDLAAWQTRILKRK